MLKTWTVNLTLDGGIDYHVTFYEDVVEISSRCDDISVHFPREVFSEICKINNWLEYMEAEEDKANE